VNRILTLTNGQYNIHPRKFKTYYSAIFLSIVAYAVKIFADEYKKVRIKALIKEQSFGKCTERIPYLYRNYICKKSINSH